MNPKHPVGPAFDQAAQRVTAWRKQQEAQLSEQERKDYAKMQRDQNKALREHEEKFQDNLHGLIDNEKAKLRDKHTPELKMFAGRKMREWALEKIAREKVHERHEQERGRMEEQHQAERDGYLHATAKSREAKSHAPDEVLHAAFRQRAQEKAQDRERGDQDRELSR